MQLSLRLISIESLKHLQFATHISIPMKHARSAHGVQSNYLVLLVFASAVSVNAALYYLNCMETENLPLQMKKQKNQK